MSVHRIYIYREEEHDSLVVFNSRTSFSRRHTDSYHIKVCACLFFS